MPLTTLLDRDTLDPIAVFEDFQQIEWTRNLMEFSHFTMVINRSQYNAGFLEKGQIIAVSDNPNNTTFDAAFIIETMESNGDDNAENDTITVSGRDVSGFFEERLTVPPSGQEYDQRTGPTESLIKFYVNTNVAFGATANRRIPNLFVRTDQARGTQYDNFKTRFDKVSNVVKEIGLNNFTSLGIMGWEIEMDLDTNTFQFDIIEGIDRTAGSANPVFFDFEFESIMQLKWLQNELDKKTFAYVGGKGEGTARTIVETFTTGTEPTGFARKELFVDASDLDDVTPAIEQEILAIRGKSVLLETIQDNTIELQVNRVGPFQYRTHWDLGDIVTIRNQNWGLQDDLKIVSIKNSLKTGDAMTDITIELDRKVPSIRQRIEQIFGTREARGRQ